MIDNNRNNLDIGTGGGNVHCPYFPLTNNFCVTVSSDTNEILTENLSKNRSSGHEDLQNWQNTSNRKVQRIRFYRYLRVPQIFKITVVPIANEFDKKACIVCHSTGTSIRYLKSPYRSLRPMDFGGTYDIHSPFLYFKNSFSFIFWPINVITT